LGWLSFNFLSIFQWQSRVKAAVQHLSVSTRQEHQKPHLSGRGRIHDLNGVVKRKQLDKGTVDKRTMQG